MECRENSSSFWGEFCKRLPTQDRIFLTFQICGILELPHVCICQYDKYINKHYTVLYMSVEVMICQSERSPERLLISHTPSIGGASNHLRWEKECGGNFPSFLDEFCKKASLLKTGYFLTFQICSILELPHVCICQYNKSGSE